MQLLNYKNYGRLWRVYGRSLLRYGTPKKILNALRTEYAYRRRIADVRSAPYILFLEPLYYCNLDCPLCDRQIFPDARKNSAGRLPRDQFTRILNEVGDYLFQVQIFGQGEPLLDWPLSRWIIQQSHQRRIFTLMSTNCTLVPPNVAAEVVASGLDHLVCAIDGISQESYARYRTGGLVEDALNGLKRFVQERDRQKSNIEIEWQFLVNKFNEHEITAAKKMADDLGVFIRFSPIRGMEFTPSLQSEWLAENPDFRAANKAEGETVYNWPCYFLWRSVVLNSNSKVARCLVYQNVAEYADLNDMTFLEAYNHPSAQRARQLFSKRPVPPGDFPSPCNNCSFYGRHHGGPNLTKPASLAPPPAPLSALTPMTVSGRPALQETSR